MLPKSYSTTNRAHWIMNLTREQKQQQLLQLIELEKRKIKGTGGFYYFFLKSWEILEPNTKLEQNWHLKYLCYIAEKVVVDIAQNKTAKHKQVLINICPRSLKSFIFNICLPVYAWILSPSMPIISNSYSLDLGLGFSRKRQILINHKWFQERFGDDIRVDRASGGRESTQETENTKLGTIYVSSTGGTITGKNMLLGINDDPLKVGEGSQEKALQGSVDFYNESFYTRQTNPKVAVIITIMQRLAQKDLAGYLTENYPDDESMLLHINLPLIADGTERIPYKEQFLNRYPEEEKNIYKHNYFFADRFDTRFINDIKKRGTIFFNTQYMQNPLPTDGILFKREWFDKISYEEFATLKRKNNLRPTFITDTAYTKNTLNDPSGLLVYYFFDNIIYLTNFITEHVDSAKLPAWMEDKVKRNDYSDRSIITVEPKGSGKVVVSLLKAYSKLNVVEYKYPSAAKVNINMSKEERAEAITQIVEAGRVVLVDGSWNETFIQQVTTFPLAAHDEAVDTLVMAVLRAHYIDSRHKKFGLTLKKGIQK